MPPIETNKKSPMANPHIAPAIPDILLSNDIVIGMSAPPIRIVKKTPKIKEKINETIRNKESAIILLTEQITIHIKLAKIIIEK
ncbi:MAG: hypothetical protein Kow00102_12680 [Spirochaetota bacterium]